MKKDNIVKSEEKYDTMSASNSLTGVMGVGSPANDLKLNNFRRINMGALQLTILTDGFMKLTPVDFFIKGATAEAVNNLLKESFRPTDHWDLSINVMVVKSENRLFLLDTGTGIFAEPSQGWLIKCLAEAGFNVADFTDIIISHVHSDHIGGLVDVNNDKVFPNAEIHMSEIEYDFWLNATVEDFIHSPLYEMKEYLSKVIVDNQHVVNLIRSSLNFFDFEKGLYDTFYFELAPGHTPGHTITTIKSKDEQLLWAADLFHSDILLLTHPEWGFLADTNLERAVASRLKWLEYIVDKKVKTFAYHVPYPGLGHVRKKNDHYEWVPEAFITA